MAMFHSYVNLYPTKPPFSYGFSYGFCYWLQPWSSALHFDLEMPGQTRRVAGPSYLGFVDFPAFFLCWCPKGISMYIYDIPLDYIKLNHHFSGLKSTSVLVKWLVTVNHIPLNHHVCWSSHHLLAKLPCFCSLNYHCNCHVLRSPGGMKAFIPQIWPSSRMISPIRRSFPRRRRPLRCICCSTGGSFHLGLVATLYRKLQETWRNRGFWESKVI